LALIGTAYQNIKRKILEKYVKAFSNLRTDKNQNRNFSYMNHRAPHKPLPRLFIMALIDQGQITEDFIEENSSPHRKNWQSTGKIFSGDELARWRMHAHIHLTPRRDGYTLLLKGGSKAGHPGKDGLLKIQCPRKGTSWCYEFPYSISSGEKLDEAE
jgi:hypothetical protein